MSVYTKRGDKGTTSLLDNKRVSKGSRVVEVIGSIDEVNSYLGVIVSKSRDKQPNIYGIQRNLFKISALLAGAKITFAIGETKKLEREIDQLEKRLPLLKNFVIPGGTRKAAELLFARALVRRAERELFELKCHSKFSRRGEKVPDSIFQYINRLSDFLFTLARWENNQHCRYP